MADLTRRGFLAQASLATGLGVAGGIGLRQLLARRTASPAEASEPLAAAPVPTHEVPPVGLALDAVSLPGPMVVHVRDVPTAEISMMVGTQELIYRDPEIVSRLVKAAVSASQAEA